jgi:poly-gamma-glutamate synthesis protein (capsule biosynthesis protein)
VIGAGANIAQARRPYLYNDKGIRVAILAYNSILPMGYWAETNRPGCAPMRAWTHYEQIEHDQPGTPCRIHTFANQDDLRAMLSDIDAAKLHSDVVIVSMHWGIHMVPGVIADYQREMAHAAIDAGAGLILGHHAHILKGVEIYKDAAILYSLCNFAVDLPMTPEHAASKGFREIQKLNPDWIPDFTSTYNFPTDSRKSVIAKCVMSDGRISEVSLLPVWIDKQSTPEILSATDPRFGEVADYLQKITVENGLNGQFVREGNKLLVASYNAKPQK